MRGLSLAIAMLLAVPSWATAESIIYTFHGVASGTFSGVGPFHLQLPPEPVSGSIVGSASYDTDGARSSPFWGYEVVELAVDIRFTPDRPVANYPPTVDFRIVGGMPDDGTASFADVGSLGAFGGVRLRQPIDGYGSEGQFYLDPYGIYSFSFGGGYHEDSWSLGGLVAASVPEPPGFMLAAIALLGLAAVAGLDRLNRAIDERRNLDRRIGDLVAEKIWTRTYH